MLVRMRFRVYVYIVIDLKQFLPKKVVHLFELYMSVYLCYLFMYVSAYAFSCVCIYRNCSRTVNYLSIIKRAYKYHKLYVVTST